MYYICYSKLFLLKNARLDAIQVTTAIFGFLKPSSHSHKKTAILSPDKSKRTKNRQPIFANEKLFLSH